ncbi:aromatic amino acid ammonia-lyase [Flavihumibacter sp. CACIAM 22H1]|uniref:HAL/PAL/TAL family ammonia-lyase n=1 Tax=Flavihumibacter sp. CACIAM 22H1 TaxID=1812911 RepID=UPI0007A7D220|nr:aromatic amino acid ammonia-lyase [Flavihumibacter sp. CACIAM 22H1]KYP14592.1 MAG: histidine ammonia-lyase [Flavihumibacter sp. CACIAM 22H1]
MTNFTIDKKLTLSDFQEIVLEEKPVSVSTALLENVARNHDFLKGFASNKIIYGINTGFGPMAQYRISEQNLNALQYNLIRSHSTGSGQPIAPVLVRGLLLARLNNFLQGYSGIHPELVELLVELLNKKVYPVIYEHGGVGASGDLVQLAHLALTLIGEGDVWYQEAIRPTAEVFAELSIQPLTIHVREGLALINGTSAMTGIALVNLLQAKKLLEWSVFLSAMTNEVVEAYDDHFSHELNHVKHHPGQQAIAKMMRSLLGDSHMIRSRKKHLYEGDKMDQDVFEDKVQEYYSLRCITQVLGPILDTIEQAEKVIVAEFNSVNDNPIIDHENANIFHGGNFHGDYVSLEMDKLKIAITKLSMLSERQLNYLLNARLNEKFPPFLNLGTLGLNFGIQGMQFTATSTVAENQTFSNPMYIHSIPNNNDNQDIVSMGSNAALLTRRVINNSFEVLVIQMITLIHAVDYLKCQDRMASATLGLYQEIQAIFPSFVDDAPRYKKIAAVRTYFEKAEPVVSRAIRQQQ